MSSYGCSSSTIDAHVREAGEHLRQRRLRADAVELEVEVVGADRRAAAASGAVVARAVRAAARSASASAASKSSWYAPGNASAPDAQRVEARLLAARRDQRVAQVVDPRPRRGRDRSFSSVGDVDGRRGAGRGRGAARSAGGRAPTPRGACSTRSSSTPYASTSRSRDALAHLRGVAVAGDEHEARHEPAVRLAVHEQPHPPPLLQAQDAHRDVEEVVDVDLEEVVARIRLEDLRRDPSGRGSRAGTRRAR